MEFIKLEREEQIEEITAAKKPGIIFKHNVTCPISKGVLRSLKEEAGILPADTPFYLLDLLTFRNISDVITERFSIPHASPQLLVIQNEKCTYNQSLYQITPEETAKALQNEQADSTGQ